MGTALKGQKPWTEASPPINSFALSGRWLLSICTQGAALGYVQIALSGRANVSLLSTVQVEIILIIRISFKSYARISTKFRVLTFLFDFLTKKP
jgi:hypothetical protein